MASMASYLKVGGGGQKFNFVKVFSEGRHQIEAGSSRAGSTQVRFEIM